MKKELMVKMLFLLVVLICLPSAVSAQKKEKKAYEWKMPGKLSGVEEMDDYLLYCDTMWYKIQTYRDSISFFRVDTFEIIDKESNTAYYAIKIVDDNGKEKSWSQSLLQGLDIGLAGTNIVLDATLVTLKATSATTAIVGAPLIALSHGKYLKAAPEIVKLATGEVKEIATRKKQQTADIKSIYDNKAEGSTDTVILVEMPEDADVNWDDLLDMNDFDMGTNDGAVELPDELKELLEQEIEG